MVYRIVQPDCHNIAQQHACLVQTRRNGRHTTPQFRVSQVTCCRVDRGCIGPKINLITQDLGNVHLSLHNELGIRAIRCVLPETGALNWNMNFVPAQVSKITGDKTGASLSVLWETKENTQRICV